MKSFSKIKEDKKGFTLVEILVVLVILAILAAVSIPTMTGFIAEARKKAYTAEARSIYVAAQAAASELSAGTSANDEAAIKARALTFLAGEVKVDEIEQIQVKDNKVEFIRYVPADGGGIYVLIQVDNTIVYGDLTP